MNDRLKLLVEKVEAKNIDVQIGLRNIKYKAIHNKDIVLFIYNYTFLDFEKETDMTETMNVIRDKMGIKRFDGYHVEFKDGKLNGKTIKMAEVSYQISGCNDKTNAFVVYFNVC